MKRSLLINCGIRRLYNRKDTVRDGGTCLIPLVFLMITTIEKDITTVTEGIICHQVNCQGVMGAGLAKRIREKFPRAYEEYMYQYRHLNLWPGNVVFAMVGPGLFVANLCGQNRYGRKGLFTNYRAVRKCLVSVADFKREYLVYIPDHMGCALGGGDWNKVSAIIEEVIPDAIIARYRKGK